MPLALSMVAAPLIAGAVGGFVVSMGLSLQLLSEFSLAEALHTGLVMSLFGVIIAIFVCYTFGAPLMLAAWALAHFASWRSPHRMGLVMAGAGMAFAVIFFHDGSIAVDELRSEGAIAFLISLPAGLLGGYMAGWFVAMVGYTGVRKDETLSS